MRAELVESKSKHEILEQELHNLILQLHSSQLSQLPSLSLNKNLDPTKHDIHNIKKRLDEEIKNSPTRLPNINKDGNDEIKINPYYIELTQLKSENAQIQLENAALRNSILALNSEVYGAKLAAKYLDKELAGRIQQLQLLGREMRGEIRDKLWRQLESEILLQRHKTVVRACRRNSVICNSEGGGSKPSVPSINEEDAQQFGDVRTVLVKRNAGQGLGISITGGREHGVPILISELESNGPAALSGQLYIGDAILSVNDRDLRQACHREAVEILQQQSGDCRLEVQYIAADDSDNSLEEDGLNFRFFDHEVCDPNDSISLHPLHSTGLMNTPTAPRTPESTTCSRTESRNGSSFPSPIPLIITKTADTKSKKTIEIQMNNNIDNIVTSFDETEENRNNTPTNSTKTINDNTTTTELITDEVNSNNIPLNMESKTETFTNSIENLQYRLNKTVEFYSKTNKNIDLAQKTTSVDNKEENLNCSTNSLVSENLSSPMQTSADIFLDSEILSTDVASNDSHSPKNIQNIDKVDQHDDETDKFGKLIEIKRFNEFCLEAKRSNVCNYEEEDLSNPRSDQSLLNSASESCDSSPLHKTSLDYKKKAKNKKYFGMKTLQNIFARHNGYSDISSTASEMGDDNKEIAYDDGAKITKQEENYSEIQHENIVDSTKQKIISTADDITAQFEENIHAFLSETFSKSKLFLDQATNGMKIYPRQQSHSMRIGKALRLTNDDQTEIIISENNKDKYTRYVSGSNTTNIEGIGDPSFGTPV
ncbi:probable serine/threonine-protein kinase DDB_G0282963 isoform X1 [Agrilus planipennis]|nr:probable serine/threonine-protein kinase DDB_G0282963 isoform X1 [Agrilus planipennis]